MALTFNGKSIPGSHGSLVFSSPEPQLRRVRFWDLKGEGEIAGENGGRPIVVEHILHEGYTSHIDLTVALNDLNKLVGVNAQLKADTGSGSGRILQSFNSTTFEGYEFRALEGQPTPGPLQDVAGTLFDDDGNADGGWFVGLTLRFRQLVAS